MDDLFTEKVDNYKFNLKEVEKKTILAAINFTKGNLSYAKDVLGISRASMYFLLKKHKIGYDHINQIREYHGREPRQKVGKI